MPTELVGCFYPGSSRENGPDFEAERPTVRGWKKEGKGYFCSNGKFFQLITAIVEAAKDLLGKGNIVPFSRSQKRVGDLHLKPDSINYPIPAWGDHRLRWHHAFMAQGKRVNNLSPWEERAALASGRPLVCEL